MVERARRGELLRLTLGEDRWALVERMQAAMSLIEGHAEHMMDEVGAEVLPSLPRLRAAMNHRRENRGLPWRVLERLLGLELKMKQYEIGRRFCDAVVADGGPQALALAWRGPEDAAQPRPSSRSRRCGSRASPGASPRRQPQLSARHGPKPANRGPNARSSCYKVVTDDRRWLQGFHGLLGSSL